MKLSLRLMACLALALATTFIWGTDAAFSQIDCQSAFVTQQGTFFTVLPTGINDTANLQCAFDAAVNTGSGSTVKLVVGTYYIDRDIAVANFDGTFVGAGKQETFVQNIDMNPFPRHGDPFPLQLWSGLFVFFQDQNAVPSSITISDLTFRAIGFGSPVNTHGSTPINTMNILEIYGKYTGIQDDEVSYLSTSLIRVGFEGQSSPEFLYGYNILNAVEFYGEFFTQPCGDSNCVDYTKPLSGNHLVQDCTFKNAVWGYAPINLQDSQVKIEGSTFENVRSPIAIWDFSNSTADIQRNRIFNATWYGVDIENGFQAVIGYDLGPHGDLPLPSRVNISQNEISVSETGDGIGIVDWSYIQGESTFENVTISHNEIRLNGTSYGALFGIGVSGLAVTNNWVTGYGGFGIYAGLWDDPVNNWVLVGNNLQNANTEWPSIILGPSTSNFTVVGGHASANVLDLGTDNMITGVNVTHDSNIGQQVREAMSDRRELRKMLR